MGILKQTGTRAVSGAQHEAGGLLQEALEVRLHGQLARGPAQGD